ncbi:hypothetical protein WDW89_17585 [Deltaproteobacteria bacterium TL4]
MISQSAKDAFCTLFNKATNETLNKDGYKHQWMVKMVDRIDHIHAREFVVLTLCSYDFRVFMTVHFTCTKRTIQYVSESLHIPPEQVTREKFYDYLGEYGNNYCGTVKRELQCVFPHLGMSTPDLLEERSFRYFEHLKFEYSLYSEAVSENNVRLTFGLYVCPYGDLNFMLPEKKEEIVSGELEFF